MIQVVVVVVMDASRVTLKDCHHVVLYSCHHSFLSCISCHTTVLLHMMFTLWHDAYERLQGNTECYNATVRAQEGRFAV